MNRVAITGATSMIGVALVEQCVKEGIEVVAIIRRNSRNIDRIPKSHLVDIVQCNLDELSKLNLSNQCDTFFHLAWDYTSKETRDNAKLQLKNIQYTLDAVELAKRLRCETFIGAGSQAEYGIKEEKINEKTPANPVLAYGVAKYSAGNLSRILCESLGIRHIWGRIFSVYGPYDNQGTLIRYMIETLLAGEEPKFTKLEQSWDYLFYKDAGRAFYLMGEAGKDKSVYCIGSGEALPLKDYVNVIHLAINPNIMLGIGEKEYSDKQVMYLCADISALTKDTGFVPNYDFKRGIYETIDWFKNKSQN